MDETVSQGRKIIKTIRALLVPVHLEKVHAALAVLLNIERQSLVPRLQASGAPATTAAAAVSGGKETGQAEVARHKLHDPAAPRKDLQGDRGSRAPALASRPRARRATRRRPAGAARRRRRALPAGELCEGALRHHHPRAVAGGAAAVAGEGAAERREVSRRVPEDGRAGEARVHEQRHHARGRRRRQRRRQQDGGHRERPAGLLPAG